jgi:hypothetical protein
MSRPTSSPDWSTDTNFPAGSDPWSATPTRVEPSSGEKADGFTPGVAPEAQVVNFLVGNHGDWINHHEDAIAAQFGNGADGAITFDGTTDLNSFSSRSGTIYTLTRDVHATNITVNAGVEVRTAGWRVYWRGVLTTGSGGTNGLITCNGANGGDGTGAVAGTGGATGAQGTLLSGAAGGAGDGSAGSNATDSYGGAGGAGGVGGGGGAGGSVTAPTAAKGSPRVFSAATFGHIFGLVASVSTSTAIQGGAGGGGGASDAGAGGAGGGVLALAGNRLALAAAADLRARGGNGGAGLAGGAQGGGGGGGGVLLLAVLDKGGATFSAAVNCTGGTGGVGDGSNNGANGSNGTVIEVLL